MPYEVVIPAIQDALIAVLEADSTLAGLLSTKPTSRGGGPAIYDDGDAPQGATMPYLTIGAWTQVGFHSLAPDATGYGWNCTVQFKAVGQRMTVLYQVMGAALAVFPQGQNLDVTGYASAWTDEVTVHPMLKEILAGVPTYQLPAILRVYVQ